MTSFNLLYPAILVFALLVIGVVLTAVEFKKLENSADGQDADQHKRK